MLLSNCEFRQNGIRNDSTFIVCKSQNIKFTLEQNMKAKREGSILSVPSVNWELAVYARDLPLYLPGKRPGTHLQEAGWALGGPVWTGAKNLATTGIRSPDCSARSESLYRLCNAVF